MVNLELIERDFKRVNTLLGQMGFNLLYELTNEGGPTQVSMDRAVLVELSLAKWRLAPNHGYSAAQMDGLLALATVYQGEQRASCGIYKSLSLADMSYTMSGSDQAAHDLLAVLKGAFYPAYSGVFMGVVR